MTTRRWIDEKGTRVCHSTRQCVGGISQSRFGHFPLLLLLLLLVLTWSGLTRCLFLVVDDDRHTFPLLLNHSVIIPDDLYPSDLFLLGSESGQRGVVRSMRQRLVVQ